MLLNLLLCTPYPDEVITVVETGCAISFAYQAYTNDINYGVMAAALFALMYTTIKDHGCLMFLPRLTVTNSLWSGALIYTALALEHTVPFKAK